MRYYICGIEKSPFYYVGVEKHLFIFLTSVEGGRNPMWTLGKAPKPCGLPFPPPIYYFEGLNTW